MANFALSVANFVFGISYFYLINPEDTKPDAANYFSKEVAFRVPVAVLIVGSIASVMMLVGSFILLPENDYIEGGGSSNELHLAHLPLCHPVFQKLYWVTAFLLLPVLYFNNNFKEFMLPIYSDHFLTILYSAGFICSTLGCLFWGYMAERYGFGRTLMVVTSSFFVVNMVLAVALKTDLHWLRSLSFLCLLGSTFMDRSIFVIMAPLLVKVFGTSVGSKMLTLKGSAAVISFAVSTLVQVSSGISTNAFMWISLVNLANPVLAFTLLDLD